MTEHTAKELVDLVEDRIKDADAAGEGWSYPVVIERLQEIADQLRDEVECGRAEQDATGTMVVKLQLTEADHAWLAGLAQVLAEAIS